MLGGTVCAVHQPNQRVEMRMSIRVPVIEEKRPINDCPTNNNFGRSGLTEEMILTHKTDLLPRSAGKM